MLKSSEVLPAFLNPVCLALGAVFFITALSVGGLHLGSTAGPRLIPTTGVGLALACVAFVTSYPLRRIRIGTNKTWLWVWAAGVALVCLSDILHRRYHPFNFAHVHTWLLLSGCILFCAWRYLGDRILLVLLIGSITALFIGFGRHTGFQLLFSDDHPAFMYRLEQLVAQFPAIPFYNPMWNAGVEAREFFPSGILSLFFLFAPVWYVLSPQTAYTAVIAVLLFCVVPACALGGALLVGVPRRAAVVAGIVALCSSLLWYRWALSYGTMGFVTTTALMPFAVGLVSRLVRERSPTATLIAISVAILSLCVLWPLMVVVLVPTWSVALVALIRQMKRPAVASLVIVAAAVHLGWMFLFAEASGVLTFLGHNGDAAVVNPIVRNVSHGYSLGRIAALVRDYGSATHPLVLMLCAAGCFLLWCERSSRLLPVQIAWLLALGTFAAPIKEQLELDRMLVAMGVVASIPVGYALHSLMEEFERRRSVVRRALLIPCFGALAVTPVAAYRIAASEGIERYYVAKPVVTDFAQAISANAGEGRTLFVGFVLHELNHGHVAPLASMSGKPLVASSYQHNLWRYTEAVPDHFYKKGEEGIIAYMDIMNATTVVAHDRRWRKWLDKRPHLFAPIWSGDVFRLYKRIGYQQSYLLSGEGDVIEQDGSSVRLRLSTAEAVLKFMYLPFVESDAGCRVEPYDAGGGVRFVKLGGCAYAKPITLRAKGGVWRLLAW